jgi:hypothetical protein
MKDVDLVFLAFVFGAALWLALLTAAARVNPRWRGRGGRLVLGLVTVLLLFMPIRGLPLWSWAFTFCPNPSLPMLGMVGASLWQHLCGVRVFKPADWRATWVFGAVAGTVLYLQPLALPSVDLYYWGWDRGPAVGTLAAVGIVFLACGNRLGVLLFAALLAFQCGALESKNCWDYVLDPFFWLTSLAVGAVRLFLRILRRSGPAQVAIRAEAETETAPSSV